jgi:DNA topoisomerase VI subunit A
MADFQSYKEIKFTSKVIELIRVCNQIIREYMRQGYTLSVRQLYYQLVARDYVENTMQSYKRVADIINNARMAGAMPWDAIEDRTREFVERTRWTSPRQIIQASHDGYHMDMWDNQPGRIFVVVEKEALTGVLDPVCRKYDVPLLAARGYPSSSVLREFALLKIMPALNAGQDVTILHLGDHDPSGIDMTRDLTEKLELFSESHHFDNILRINRIALTMDQIDDQQPPPNPAKTTDSRYADYRDIYGEESWELDALTPQFIDNLVSAEIENLRDEHAWDARREVINKYRNQIKSLIPQVSGDEDIDQDDSDDEGEE